MSYQLDVSQEKRVTELGLVLASLKFQFGAMTMKEEEDEDNQPNLYIVVALAIVCGIPLAYSFSFNDVMSDPDNYLVAEDNDWLDTRPWLILEKQIHKDWRVPLARATAFLNTPVPLDVDLELADWLHAVVAFHHFWVENGYSRWRAQSALEGYCEEFAQYSPQILQSLGNQGLVPN